MTTELHRDTGAAALDALPAGEVDSFEQHLVGCEPCAAEYAGFLATTALLGAAVAEPAPESLERSLMRLIAVTPQLPPSVRPVGEVGAIAAPRRYRRRWVMATAAAVAAVVVAVGVVLAVRGWSTGTNGADARSCVEHASDAVLTHPSVGAGGEVTAAASCRAAIVVLPELPGLPTGRGYQLWVMAGTDARSVGMVAQIAAGGSSVVALEPDDTAVGISVEPRGGSKTPTTQPVWVAPLIG